MTKLERFREIYADLRERGIIRNKKQLAEMLGVNYNGFTQATKGSDPSRLSDNLMAKLEALYADPNLEPMKKESSEWVYQKPEPKPMKEEQVRPGSIVIPPELADMFTDLAATIRSQQRTIERLTSARTIDGLSEKSVG